MTDERVQKTREEPVRVRCDAQVLLMQATDRLSRLELFRATRGVGGIAWP